MKEWLAYVRAPYQACKSRRFNLLFLYYAFKNSTTPVFGLLLLEKMRYAVFVTGPAGAGKSTFSTAVMTHLQASKRTGHLVNLDPAAAPESFEYTPSIDIKDLISLEDVMSELGYGPNGGLVYCFE